MYKAFNIRNSKDKWVKPARMEEAKGEQQKGQIAIRMGDAVSRALGSSGRKRSINI